MSKPEATAARKRTNLESKMFKGNAQFSTFGLLYSHRVMTLMYIEGCPVRITFCTITEAVLRYRSTNEIFH